MPEKSALDSDVSATSSYPVRRRPSWTIVRTCSSGRSRTGRVIIPAWQKRQPRVHPRKISTFNRSCTTSTSGTSWFFGYGHSARSATVRLSMTGGTSAYTRDHRAQRRTVVLDVVHRGHVHAVDRGEIVQHRFARRAAPRFHAPTTSAISPMTSSPSPITNASTYSASGSGLYVQWPPAITMRMLGCAVLVAHRHAGEVDEVEQVRVDELGRQVEREHVERVGGLVGVDAEQRHARGAHRVLHVGPRRVRPFGDRVGPLVQDLVEDLQALVGEPDLVRVGVDQEKCGPAGPMVGRQTALLHTDIASGLLNPGQQRFDPRPQVVHLSAIYLVRQSRMRPRPVSIPAPACPAVSHTLRLAQESCDSTPRYSWLS